MAQFRLLVVVLTAFLLISTAMSGKVTNPSQVPKNAVLLSKISSLTLRHGKHTTSRRIAAVPQLECIGPAHVCRLYSVDVMRCVNEGADYDAENIQWSCKASLPEEFKLGSTDVLCEGYESSDDPYILKGSCGVEYRLMLTDLGEQKYGRANRESTQWPSSTHHDSNLVPKILFFIIFMAVLFIILRGMWSSWHQNPPRLGGTRPNGGGNDDDDPPPPYDDPPSYYSSLRPKTKKTTPRTNTSTRASSSRSAPQTERAQSWRPGFWTGTAAGAAAGYLAGNRSQTQSNTRQPETQQRPGGLFSNFGRTQQQAQPSSSTQSSSSTPSYSSTRHESTGFGNTKRR